MQVSHYDGHLETKSVLAGRAAGCARRPDLQSIGLDWFCALWQKWASWQRMPKALCIWQAVSE